MNRYILLVLVMSAFIFTSHAKEELKSDTKKDTLSVDSSKLALINGLEKADSLSGASVIVTKDGRINIVKKENSEIRGYRIRIFFDNSQKARSKAKVTKDKFKELFADIPAYISYSAPYFTVSAGDFMSYEEALKTLQDVVKEFPKSFITQEDIPMAKFEKK